MARYDFRDACAAIVALAEAGNRFIETEVPWQLAREAEAGDRLDVTTDGTDRLERTRRGRRQV